MTAWGEEMNDNWFESLLVSKDLIELAGAFIPSASVLILHSCN